jgi:hypothetical protein
MISSTVQGGVLQIHLSIRFKYKFELQTDGQFNKSKKTTQMTSSQCNVLAWRSSKNRTDHQKLTSTEVIKHMGKTEVIKHMSDSPRVMPFNHHRADLAAPPPSHEARSHV